MSGITISDLYEMQKKLDERIIREKGLEGKDLLPNIVLALQVEIAELANEWRGFKHWSNDREPRYERKCHACKGKGRFSEPDAPEEICLYCEGTGVEARPLLEEYVDCLHFFLSIARQLGISASNIYEYMLIEMDSDTSKVFTKIINRIGAISLTPRRKDKHWFIAWTLFMKLGRERLGFSFKQITEAYLAKNHVNHARQENGY